MPNTPEGIVGHMLGKGTSKILNKDFYSKAKEYKERIFECPICHKQIPENEWKTHISSSILNIDKSKNKCR